VTSRQRLLPAVADHDYRGSPIARWALLVVLVPLVGRSLVHFLKADAGLNSIATLHTFPAEPGEPDPDRVIHMLGAMWGSQQLVTAAVAVLVVWRYRSLIPLIWLLLAIEAGLRIAVGVMHPLGPEFYATRPPGAVGNLPMLVLCLAMTALALRPGRAAAGEASRRRHGDTVSG